MEVYGKMPDIIEEGASDNLDNLCEVCEIDHVTTKAIGVCHECDECMCRTCFTTHIKVKSCRQHVLVDIDQAVVLVPRRVEDKEKCKHHANESMKYYCRKHETVGCGDCMIPVHGPCKPENVRDLSKQFYKNDDFINLMRNLQYLKTTNHENDQKVQENKIANEVMLEKALKDIKSFRSQINTYLDRAEASVIKDAKDIERNNNKRLAKLEQDCKLLSSKITDVRQNLNTELFQDSALFIQTVECKPRMLEIEREVSRIQKENNIRTLEFIPDTQLQNMMSSTKKLGILDTNERRSTTNPYSKGLAKEVKRSEIAGNVKQSELMKGKKEKGQEQPRRYVVGTRVRPVGDCLKSLYWYHNSHKGQQGTMTAVNADGTVSVKWDATGSTDRCWIGFYVELI